MNPFHVTKIISSILVKKSTEVTVFFWWRCFGKKKKMQTDLFLRQISIGITHLNNKLHGAMHTSWKSHFALATKAQSDGLYAFFSVYYIL